MHAIREFFFLKNIYHRQTIAGMFFYYLYLLLITILATSFGPNIDDKYEKYFTACLYLFFVISVYLLIRSLLRNYIVDQRTGTAYWDGAASKSTAINESSIDFELDKVDQTQNLYEEKGLAVYDAIFNFYRRTKYGQKLTKQAYYTVIETHLIRKLPNLIFDSKSAKKRQFKNLFLGSQRISLEGDFDNYFDTYTPQTYHIDSLSFISPEVMEKIIECKDYDVEIIGDKLLVYGPLLDEEEINIMYGKALSLTKAINDNIDTYKENRLAGKSRHTEITAFGRKLLQNPARYYPGIFLFTGLSALMIYLGNTVDGDFFFNEISVAIYLSLGGLIYKAAKIDIHNRKMMKKYLG